MRVREIKAYKSDDDCIWETEEEAIAQNIENCIGKSELSHGDGYSDMMEKIREWFRNHPKEIKYIQANINKI